MVRIPAVAGSFYPADPGSLMDMLEGMIHPQNKQVEAHGIVVPHAGYIYSGEVAAAVYSRIVLPKRFIIMCPNHTGLGRRLAIMSSGEWNTPLGNVPIDQQLATDLKRLDSDLEEDPEAHRSEHALEVQLPFLQFLGDAGVQFVPITVGTSEFGLLRRLGQAIAELIAQTSDSVLVVASSDMNHYESDERTRRKDQAAIAQLLALNPEGLYDTVIGQRISMCGFGPATAMLFAANRLGASRADLIRYQTSGDVSGDRDRVVGYAGVIVS